MKLTFLGTGTSVGVPVIGCDCPVCSSPEPRNERTRSSVLIEWNRTNILIDTSVDFRQQMLRENISDIDFILYTHAHADHIMGLDDIRPVNSLHDRSIDCYGQSDTLETIRETFDYIFNQTPNQSWKPEITLNPIQGPTTIDRLTIIPLPVHHGNIEIYGYRLGDLAYVSDVNNIPSDTLSKMDNLDVLVLDALRDRQHPTHFTVEESIRMARTIDADHTYFTHMTHNLDYHSMVERLPQGIEPAYDGLTIEL